jgi:protein-histidine pros-kinase
MRIHLLLISILLTMGPVVIFGLLQTRVIRDREIGDVASRHQVMAISIAREIEFFISDAVDNLQLLAGAIAQMTQLRAKVLEAHVRQALGTRTIDHIAVMTPSGRSIVNLSRNGRLQTGVDYSDRPYFRAVIASRSPQLSEVIVGKASRRPEVFLAVPVLDRHGTLRAILVGGLDMAELHNRHLSQVGAMQPRARTLLLEPSGRPLATSDRTLEEVFAASGDVRIAPKTWETDSRLLAWTDDRAQHTAGASAYLPTWKWRVLSGIPEERFHETFAAPIRRLGFMALWLLLACVLASPLVARIVAAPIAAMQQQARRIAGGALGEKITLPPYLPRELGDLSSSFNTMSAQLARNYREASAVGMVAQAVSQSLDLHAILQGSLATIADVIALDAALVFLLEGDELRVAAHLGLSDEFVHRVDRMSLGEGFVGRVAASAAPLLVEDMWVDPRLARDVVKKEGFHSLASVPLSSKGRLLGVLSIMGRGIRQFSEDELTLVTTIGAQIGLAVENAGLYAQAQARLKEAEAFAEISRQLSSSLDPEMVILTIVRWAKELCSSDLAVFAPYDPIRRVATITACVGARTQALWNYEIEAGKGVDGRVLETGEPFITNDYFNDPRVSQECAELGRIEGFVAKLAVPVRSRDKSIGLLWVINRHPIPFTQQHQEILQKLAAQAAVALENTRLYQEAQERLQETKTLLAVSQALSSTLDLQESLRRGARELARALHADSAGASLISPDGQDLQPFSGYHLPKDKLSYIRATPIPVHLNRFIEEGFIARRATFSSHCQLDPRFDETITLFSLGAVVMVPFFARDEILGSLFAVWWEKPHTPTPRELELADGIGRQLTLAIENARLHQESLDRAAALAESEDRYRRLTEGAMDLIFTVDVKGKFTYVNPRAREALGYQPEELLGKPSIAYVVPRDQDLVREVFARALRGESAFDVYQIDAIRKDGSTIPLEVGSSTICDAEGPIIGRQIIARDLTERRRLEDEVRERKRLEETNRFKSQFLANMSHELRTPLHSVIGFSEILQDGRFGPLAEKQARFVKNIAVSGRHLLALIDDVLDLAKIEAGKMKLHRGLFDICAVIDKVCAVMQHQADVKHHTVRIEVDSEASVGFADHQRVQQIMLNLLSNAIKFTPDGGRITVTAKRVPSCEFRVPSSEAMTEAAQPGTWSLEPGTPKPPDCIEVSVADTGIGISSADLPRLFREFEQLEPFYTKHHQGTGLGLALCKRLVELQDGRIWASSEGAGRGSTFTFTIRAAAPPDWSSDA